MPVTSKKLVADVQCDQTVRALRWPDGIACPAWQSTPVSKRGVDDTEPARHRFECPDCHTRFADGTDTIAGPPQPLKVGRLCRYFMGLHLSNEQIAHELAVNVSEGQQLTTQLRHGSVKKASGDAGPRGRRRCSLWDGIVNLFLAMHALGREVGDLRFTLP